MEGTFSERIEAEIRRGEIDSPAAEEAAQLEGWIRDGVPAPDATARRFKDNS
ncbi:hypothetical protein [Paenarthrobacter sp. YIM B13468]|uniref:hypothetical protein n=1 Tax=Paenarthrobacter sp. YIM B13468 TaxID=3366295 RepID=UPI003670A110